MISARQPRCHTRAVVTTPTVESDRYKLLTSITILVLLRARMAVRTRIFHDRKTDRVFLRRAAPRCGRRHSSRRGVGDESQTFSQRDLRRKYVSDEIPFFSRIHVVRRKIKNEKVAYLPWTFMATWRVYNRSIIQWPDLAYLIRDEIQVISNVVVASPCIRVGRKYIFVIFCLKFDFR